MRCWTGCFEHATAMRFLLKKKAHLPSHRVR